MGVLAFILFDSPRSTESTGWAFAQNQKFSRGAFCIRRRKDSYDLLGTVGRDVCGVVCNEGMIVRFERRSFLCCIFIDWAHASGCLQTERRCKLMHKIDE